MQNRRIVTPRRLLGVILFALLCLLLVSSWMRPAKVFSMSTEDREQQPPSEFQPHRPQEPLYQQGRDQQAEQETWGQPVRNKENCESSSDLPLAMMERDVTWNEPWPELEIGVTPPGQVAPAVHYVWCGSKQLLFQHYLGLLSALRVLKPLKFYFHYTHGQPVIDNLWYNNWFEEFKEAVPVMDMRQMDQKYSCGSKEMLKAILDILTSEGGVYLGERLVLAGIPAAFYRQSTWYAFASGDKDLTRGIVYLTKNFTGTNVKASDLADKILADRRGCVSVQKMNELGHGQDRKCISLDQTPNYPRDIWDARTTFGEVARWLFYGRRAPYAVKRDPSRPIPRISHYIRVQSKEKPMYQDTLSFTHFLSIMSALHVGGFHHVYVHVDKEPVGPWWDKLKTENVTVLKLEKPNLVYQQKITGITHFSDVSRYNILYRHGGVYQDFDCVWTSRVPDELLEYPVVISPAISQNPPWPDGLALGMLMTRPGSPFIRHAFKGYRRYRGENYLYNAIMRSYRTYEHYPDAVRFDPHFSVFCVENKCFPRWMRESFWDLKKNGGRDLPWSTETRAFHLVIPKVWKSFASPAALKNGQDMVADVGRNIMRKSGRMSILDNA